MFATLLGGLPRPTDETEDADEIVRLAIRAQEESGLEPITDGRLRDAFERLPTPELAVEAWRSAQSMTERAVKQALPGPYARGGDLATAGALSELVSALAEAGCPLIEIEENRVDGLADEEQRGRFRALHERLLESAPEAHLSLSIVGGAPHPDAWAAVLDLPYASLAVDLIAGPDSWNLVTRLPGDRGVIAGVESARKVDEPKEVLLWAAHYAASTQGRGKTRVGLGSSGSWANLAWEAAVRKMRLLGEAAELAAAPPSPELVRMLDPRAVDPRRAALGHDRPRAPSPPPVED